MMNSPSKNNKLIGDIIVALLLSVQFINCVICAITGAEEGYVSILFVAVGILLVFHYLSDGFFTVRITTNSRFLIIFFIVLIGYVYTITFQSSKTSLTTSNFACRCILPLIIGFRIHINPKRVLKLMMTTMIIGVPFLQDLFAKGNAGSYEAVTMGTSYAILPVVMAGIIHFIIYRKVSTVFEKVLYVITAIYTAYFVAMSYRGALFSLFLLVFILLILENDKKSIGRAVLLIVFVFSGIAFVIFKNQIIIIAAQILSTVGIRVASLEKAIILASQGDTMHGRLDIYLAAIDGIIQAPLFGHGYATFKYYTGIGFQHNFVLELLYDLGIPIGLFIIISIFGALINRLKYYSRTNKEQFVFLLLLVCCSVPRVMVSAESWIVISLWYMIGYIFQKTHNLYDGINQDDKIDTHDEIYVS